jgi:hypothetical protein
LSGAGSCAETVTARPAAIRPQHSAPLGIIASSFAT